MSPCLRDLLREDALPRLERQMLWQHVLGVSRAWLIAHDTDPLPSSALARYRALETRRLGGEPMAYILGEREFMGHALRTTPDVLIPRPETELLVACALHAAASRAKASSHGMPAAVRGGQPPSPSGAGLNLLDLGTGSGAVAIALALACPDARVVATDASQAALEVARDNAARLGAPIDFFSGNWYQALPANMAFDVIVSNPPYIAASDPHLQQGDVRFEPRGALTDGADGLQALHVIVSQAAPRLRAGGGLFVEHGWDQGPAVRALFEQAGFHQIATHPDLAGIGRVTGGHSATTFVENT